MRYVNFFNLKSFFLNLLLFNIFSLLFKAVLGQDDDVDGKNPVGYHTTSDPEAKDNEDDVEPELEAIYEPPPSSNRYVNILHQLT